MDRRKFMAACGAAIAAPMIPGDKLSVDAADMKWRGDGETIVVAWIGMYVPPRLRNFHVTPPLDSDMTVAYRGDVFHLKPNQEMRVIDGKVEIEDPPV